MTCPVDNIATHSSNMTPITPTIEPQSKVSAGTRFLPYITALFSNQYPPKKCAQMLLSVFRSTTEKLVV